ncbi:MAG: DUF2470 domain-containing protein [Pseudomonadota bacterium]
MNTDSKQSTAGRNDREPASEDQARAARRLLAGRLYGVISTQSLEIEGHPFGSVAPYCLDYAGRPLFLLSRLAQHTRNIEADPRVALTLVGPVGVDVQQAERLVGVGSFAPIEGRPTAAVRYFRYFPDAGFYFESLDFGFYGFEPQRWHFNSGFATARWFANDRILRANPFTPAVEESVCSHMNQDHGAALEHYLRDGGIEPEEEVRLCGVDATGMEIYTGGGIERVEFPREVADAGELRNLLAEMAGA